MEALLSALVGELFSRFMSSMIRRCTESMTAGEKLERLRSALLRAHTVVEEASARRVTNGAMLLQLSILMEAMYRGHYVLDTFKYGGILAGAPWADQEMLLLSTFGTTTGKRRRRSVLGSEAMDELRSVLGRLETSIADMQEFVVFLGNYPRMFCQPYSTYMFVDNCMFGRQAELHRIIAFLLRKEPERSSAAGLDVLPLIGRRGAGKRTLVEHVCKDERVRCSYPVIIRICADGLDGTPMAIEQRKNFQDGRSYKTLFIVEVDGDVDEAAWRRFYDFCSSTLWIGNGSKIVITSATDAAVARLATTVPVRLHYLSPEEYWYFFKARAFGATDPDDHPELAGVAMAVVAELRCSFMYANMYGGLMRANMDARFWRGLLRGLRGHMRQHLSICGENPMDLIGKNRPSYVHRMDAGKGSAGEVYLLYNYRSTAVEQVGTLPRVSMQDLIVGQDVPADDRFEVLGWRSNIPPYYCYLATCEKRRTMRRGSPVMRRTTMTKCER